MRPNRRRLGWPALAVAGAVALTGAMAVQAQGESNTTDEIAKYRQMLAEGNPAELWEAAGEELWKKPAGPKNVSLER